MATGAGRQTGPVHLPSLDVDVCPVTGSVEFLRLHASYLPKMEKSISRKEQVLGIVQGGCAGSSRKKGKVASPHSKHVDDEKLPESTVPKQRFHGHGRAQSGCHRRKGGSGRKRRTTNRDRRNVLETLCNHWSHTNETIKKSSLRAKPEASPMSIVN